MSAQNNQVIKSGLPRLLRWCKTDTLKPTRYYFIPKISKGGSEPFSQFGPLLILHTPVRRPLTVCPTSSPTATERGDFGGDVLVGTLLPENVRGLGASGNTERFGKNHRLAPTVCTTTRGPCETRGGPVAESSRDTSSFRVSRSDDHPSDSNSSSAGHPTTGRILHPHRRKSLHLPGVLFSGCLRRGTGGPSSCPGPPQETR